ncbi:hypothetical protein BJ912DRAFT_945417 [Pholiota molesta]|nr:hypothetical protein BJ912DRAFT_945417 [Pholiota molesta]
MPSSLYVPFLLAGMILTGSSNSLWSKWQDMQCVENCADPNPAAHVLYEQPVWQTLQMFGFLPVIYTWLRSRSQRRVPNKLAPQSLSGWKPLLLWVPAALMNVGLLYTPVSIYQMTRGALVLFVGVFSVIFLRRRLWLYQWVSLIIVMSGVGLVGYSGSLIKDAVKESIVHNLARALGLYTDPNATLADEPEVTKVLVGAHILVLFAQVFTATQFVVEGSPLLCLPLVAVGYEGLFGTISILLFVPILALPAISNLSPFFDLPRGWTQMITTPAVLYSGLAICLSISLFNFFGLSVTRHVSATARSLTDTCRTLSIWIISLGLGWERLVFPISLLQVLGFALLFLFNNLISEDEEERVGLLSASVASIDETAVLPADLGLGGFDVVPEGEHVLSASAQAGKAKAKAP